VRSQPSSGLGQVGKDNKPEKSRGIIINTHGTFHHAPIHVFFSSLIHRGKVRQFCVGAEIIPKLINKKRGFSNFSVSD